MSGVGAVTYAEFPSVLPERRLSARTRPAKDCGPDGAKKVRPLTQASIGEIASSRARRVQPAILIAKA